MEWKGQPFETAPHTHYNSAIDDGKGFIELMRIIFKSGVKMMVKIQMFLMAHKGSNRIFAKVLEIQHDWQFWEYLSW